MIESLHISANGMQGQQKLIDTISHNIANINTTAFKADRVQFSELVAETNAQLNLSSNSGLSVVEENKYSGVSVAAQVKDFSAGELNPTGRELDIAIVGNGFFELIDSKGDLYYTRSGAFQTDSDGYLTSLDGKPLSGLIQLPSDTVSVLFTESGEVYAELPDRPEPMLLGRLELAHFVSPEGLDNVGNGLFQTTEKSGEAQFYTNDHQPSTIAQGHLETSNVDMVTELTSLVLAQKAYGLNSRLLQASDEILGLINDLRR